MPVQRWFACLAVLLFAFSAVPSRALDEPTPTATVTPAGETIRYTVQPGDTLGRIAARFGVTSRAIAELNELANPQLIVIGQALLIPAQPTTTPAPADATPLPFSPEAAAETTPETTLEAAAAGFDYGIEIFPGGDPNETAAEVEALGMNWAKLTLAWREVEATPGTLDFGTTDALIDLLTARGVKIMITLTDAPGWARSSSEENGPPDDFGAFAGFASAVASRYSGRAAAYEIWNEPNLRREWHSAVRPLSPDAYADLLRAAYSAIKSADASALVISAGLAPTGIDDGFNALNDRAYLQALYRAGLPDISDGIGVHPYGYANPPEAMCCDAPPGVTTHYGHPSFYFLDTLDDYRAIMLANGDFDTRLWVTRFGWGTSADGDAPPRNSIYMSYMSLDQQADYVAHAFEAGAKLDYVGAMIAYNLNGCAVEPPNDEACYYSLINRDGAARPVYDRLRLMFANAGDF